MNIEDITHIAGPVIRIGAVALGATGVIPMEWAITAAGSAEALQGGGEVKRQVARRVAKRIAEHDGAPTIEEILGIDGGDPDA